MAEFETKLGQIPDLSRLDKLEKAINENNKFITEIDSKFRSHVKDQSDVNTKVNERLDSLEARMTELEDLFESKMAEVMALIKELRERPVVEGGPSIDYDMFASRDQMASLEERMKAVEIRNIEQDDRLTNNELRISKLEKMINDPLERIKEL
jgi:uncharacterized protein YqgV (UPF0045/DUF77 family)